MDKLEKHAEKLKRKAKNKNIVNGSELKKLKIQKCSSNRFGKPIALMESTDSDD